MTYEERLVDRWITVELGKGHKQSDCMESGQFKATEQLGIRVQEDCVRPLGIYRVVGLMAIASHSV